MLWVLAQEVDFFTTITKPVIFHIFTWQRLDTTHLRWFFTRSQKAFWVQPSKPSHFSEGHLWTNPCKRLWTLEKSGREIFVGIISFNNIFSTKGKSIKLSTYLADHHILLVKMPTKHFGSVATGTLNFYAHLLGQILFQCHLQLDFTSSPFLAEGTSCSFFCNKVQ